MRSRAIAQRRFSRFRRERLRGSEHVAAVRERVASCQTPRRRDIAPFAPPPLINGLYARLMPRLQCIFSVTRATEPYSLDILPRRHLFMRRRRCRLFRYFRHSAIALSPPRLFIRSACRHASAAACCHIYAEIPAPTPMTPDDRRQRLLAMLLIFDFSLFAAGDAAFSLIADGFRWRHHYADAACRRFQLRSIHPLAMPPRDTLRGARRKHAARRADGAGSWRAIRRHARDVAAMPPPCRCCLLNIAAPRYPRSRT